MKIVPARVPAIAVLLSVALVVLSTGPVFAKSGPDSPGHHYGQEKHQQQPSSAGVAGSTTTQSRVPLTIPAIGLGTNGPRPAADVKPVKTWSSGAGLEWLLLLILPLLLAVGAWWWGGWLPRRWAARGAGAAWWLPRPRRSARRGLLSRRRLLRARRATAET